MNDRPWPLNWIESSSPHVIASCGTMLIVCIGILSFLTGPQLSCSLFYLIPILMTTRVAGFGMGAAAAALAASVWLIADLFAGLATTSFMPYLNAVMRLGTFLVAVSLVSAMRSLNAHLEERVAERTAALESEIAEKRELEKNILEISDRERASVGQDLHDGLCQQLVSAAFSTNMLHRQLQGNGQANASDMEHIAELIDDSITQARNLARGLYPVRLETEGLEMALCELVSTMSRRFAIECTVECATTLPKCRSATGIHLYRIAQEAMVNAAKHASARNVMVSLSRAADDVILRIDDDGCGIPSELRNPTGMGLRIMEYRTRLIGAEFHIEKRSPAGTSIRCAIPVACFRELD